MKIAFYWPFDKAKEILPNWRDGHRKAIEEIALVHQVDWYFDNKIEDKYDFLLMWDDGTTKIPDISARKGLMLTTENTIGDNLRLFDVVFCESEPIKEKVRRMGIRAIKAMGTDTDFYTPKTVDKNIDFFYPATFSPWKLQSKIAYLGKKLLCVGTVQPDGIDELEQCKKWKVNIEIGYFPAEKIRGYYNRSKSVVIPAIHGSERTVLEAMSMDITPFVTNSQNHKARSYIEEFMLSKYDSPREFILNNYSHIQYSQSLLKGIEQ